MHRHKFSSVLLINLLLLLNFYGCKSEPEPINYGQDECDFCRMQISDNRYGCELITDKGKVFKFDEVGCMIDYALVENLIGDANQKFLVTDFAVPESFIDASNGFYVHNENFRSPMGLNVTAFDSEPSRQKFVAENNGHLLNWVDVIEMVKQRSM